MCEFKILTKKTYYKKLRFWPNFDRKQKPNKNNVVMVEKYFEQQSQLSKNLLSEK